MSLADLNPIPVSAVEVGARPLVAMAAGALIGVERQWHHRAAGVRTHALLALGAAGFALIAHLLAVRDPQMNPAQITAGVVSGIGFLCGGVILHRGGSVQGLTSAASLWTTAGVGVAIGGGFYPLASVLLAADPDRPVSAALGGGPARAEDPVAAAAVLSLAAADAGEPPGGGAALGTLPRKARGRRGGEPRRDSETP